MTTPLTPDPVVTPAPEAATDLDALIAGGAQIPVVPEVDPALATAEPETVAEVEPEAAAEADLTAEVEDDTPLLAVEIPHFRQDQAPLNLEGVPQEAADAMRFHIKRSAEVPQLKETVAAAQEDMATVQFLRENPAEGLFMLEKLAPQAAVGFVRSWLERYPQEAVKLVTDLRYDVDLDPYTVETRARAAKVEADQRTDKGAQVYQQRAQEQRFVTDARAVLNDVAATLQLDATSARGKIFRQVAADAMQDAYRANPRITAEGLTLALQDTIAEFQRSTPQTGKTLKVKAPVEQPRAADGTFTKDKLTHAAKVASTARKLAPGVQPISATPAMSAPKDGTLYDLIGSH